METNHKKVLKYSDELYFLVIRLHTPSGILSVSAPIHNWMKSFLREAEKSFFEHLHFHKIWAAHDMFSRKQIANFQEIFKKLIKKPITNKQHLILIDWKILENWEFVVPDKMRCWRGPYFQKKILFYENWNFNS